MKKLLGILIISCLLFSISCQEKKSTENEAWKPTKNIEWVVTSSPGGGSDIFTRILTDIVTKKGFTEESFVVNNQTDGAGEVGRLRVSRAKNDGHLLLTFNSADLRPMIINTDNRIENFKPICILASDRQLFIKGKQTPYKDLAEAIAAAKSGTKVTMGGSKGDDIEIYEMFLKSAGLTEEQMTYIMYDATSDAITALLGGHVDLALVKPASAMQYLKSGDAEAIVTLANERYTGALADVPILSEIGDYENIDLPLWRGVVTSADTPDEAVKFYSDMFQEVANSPEWKSDYIEKNLLAETFMPYDVASEYMKNFQETVLAAKK